MFYREKWKVGVPVIVQWQGDSNTGSTLSPPRCSVSALSLTLTHSELCLETSQNHTFVPEETFSLYLLLSQKKILTPAAFFFP